MYYSFKLSETLNTNTKINEDLASIVSLSEKHLLRINAKKSCVMLFGFEKHRLLAMQELNIHIGSDTLTFSSHCKNLGLFIDSKLHFDKHITEKIKKAYSSLKLIYPHRSVLNHQSKKMLTDSLILSQFTHCDTVYGPFLRQTDARRIQKVQNSCLRLIYGIRRRNRISHKLKEIGWLSMYNRRKLHSYCLFYKILKTKNPPYLYNKIKFRTNVHNLNLRMRNKLAIPSHKKEAFKASFTYQIASAGHVLDVPHYALSFSSFKNKHKNKLLLQQ